MIRKPSHAFVLLCVLLSAVSCASFQKDLLVSSADEEVNGEIASLESLIVPFDAGEPNKGELQAARARISELERRPVQDTVFQARLSAWSGRLSLLEGKEAEAEKRLKKSVSLLPGDITVLVLSARLERNPEKRLVIIDDALKYADTRGELLIERARTVIELKRYREAVASFDTAFALLPPLYAGVYKTGRDEAWDLRALENGTSDATALLVGKNALLWKDAIELTQSETNLLRFFTAGKEWSAAQLYSRLLAGGFIAAGEKGAVPVLGSPFLRSDAAYFLWHLLSENRSDPALLTKYTKRILTLPKPVSPVPDVPLGAPYFDSALGCIEWEIMTLPDGKLFLPSETVKGSAFLQMLKKTQN